MRGEKLMGRASQEFGRRHTAFLTPAEALLLHRERLVDLDPSDIPKLVLAASEGDDISRWLYFNITDTRSTT